MSTIGNIVWFFFCGLVLAVEYLISSVILCLTIIGFPFGIQIFKLAKLSLFPFGKSTIITEKQMAAFPSLSIFLDSHKRNLNSGHASYFLG
jgi:uncharacterized membrane protein YccF (DUF307 family)